MSRLLRPSLTVVAVMFLLAGGPPLAGKLGEKTALVTVVAEAGTPVLDLAVKDFIVKEDGKKREVLSVKVADDLLSVALLVDTAKPAMGAEFPTRDLRTATAAFVTSVHAVNPDAGIALWQVAGAATVTVDFTNKGDDLQRAIARLYPDQQSAAVMLEALDAAAKKLATRPAPRRALVSVDFNSPEGSTDRMVQQSADSITKSGATFWAISVRGTGPSNANREEVLDKLTRSNGGRRFSSIDGTGLEANLKKLAATLASQYVVTFTSPSDSPAKATAFETTRGVKVLATPFMR